MSLPMDNAGQQQQPANNFSSFQFPSQPYAAPGASNNQHQKQMSNQNTQKNSNSLPNNMHNFQQQGWPTAPPLMNRFVKYFTLYPIIF